MKKTVCALLVLAMMLSLGVAGAEDAKGKVLLVSKAVMDPLAFKPLYDHFPETGYEFYYRRWHPTLVKSDVEDFDVIIMETGSHPAPGPTRIYAEEANLLKGFVEEGGTLVILATAGRRAQNEGKGSTSVYHINKLLNDLKTKIQFEGNRLMQATGYKSTLIPSSYFLNMPMVEVAEETPLSEGISGPFPGGRIMSLLVGKDKGIEVAVTTDPLAMRMVGMDSTDERGLQGQYAGEPQRAFPVMAAAKAGEGHVIVTSQSLLNMNGWTGRWSDKPILPPYELADNRTFDRNFVHYIADIDSGAYELQDVIPMKRVDHFGAPKKPEDVDDRTVGLRETAPENTYEDLIAFEDVEPFQPDYLDGKKVMSGFTSVPANLDHIKTQVEGYEEMGLNLIYLMCGDTLYRRRPNAESYQDFMEIIYGALELYRDAGIKVMLGGFHPSRHAWQKKQYDTTLVDGNGVVYELPSPLDPESWEDTFASLARTFAQIAKKYPDTVVGCFWDFELYAHRELIISESYPFDNYAFLKFVRRMNFFEGRPNLYAQAMGVDQARRFSWLEKNGLLEDYFRCMEEEIFEMAKKVREEQEAIHPGLDWGFYVAGIPETWYYRGVFRGLSDDDNRVLVATYEARGRQQMNYWNAQGIKLMHLPGVLMAIPEDQEWVDFLHMSMEQESGYWLFPVAITTINDSAWRTQKNDSVMSQPGSEIREWVRKANDTWKN